MAFSSIVVGTDGSMTASEAVRHAVMFSKMSGATLHVVCAYQTGGTMTSLALASAAAAASVGLADMAEDHAREVLKRAKGMADQAGVAVETYLQPGDPADVLVMVSESVGAELLVTGNKGMAGLRRVLGSVPNKVSHRAPCSLLIINTAT